MDSLVEEGWPGLTHRRVAARAEANPALVKYYFGNLEGLRTAIARQASDQLIVPAMEQLGASRSTEQMIDRCVELTEASVSRPYSARLLTQLIVGMSYYPEVGKVIKTDLTRAESTLARRIADLGPQWNPAHAQQAAELLIATLDGIVLRSLSEGVPRDDAYVSAKRARLRRTIASILQA